MADKTIKYKVEVDTSQAVKSVDDFNTSFKNVENTVEKGFKGVEGITGAFEAYEGVMAAAGVENKDFEKTMTKVAAAMAVADGVQKVSNSLFGETGVLASINTIAMKAWAVAQTTFTWAMSASNLALKAFRVALIGTGIGAVIVAIGILVSNWDKLTEAVGLSSAKVDDFKAADDKAFGSAEQRDAHNEYLNNIKKIGIEMQFNSGEITRARADELLGLVGLTQKKQDIINKYSIKEKELREDNENSWYDGNRKKLENEAKTALGIEEINKEKNAELSLLDQEELSRKKKNTDEELKDKTDKNKTNNEDAKKLKIEKIERELALEQELKDSLLLGQKYYDDATLQLQKDMDVEWLAELESTIEEGDAMKQESIDLSTAYLNNELVNFQVKQDQKLNTLNQNLAEGLISESEYNDEVYKLKQNDLQNDLQNINNKLSVVKSGSAEELALLTEKTAKEQEIKNNAADEDIRKLEEKKQKLLAIFEFSKERINDLQTLSDIKTNLDIGKQDKLLKNGKITQEQYDKNVKEIQIKAAKREKALSVTNAIINTAVGITKAIPSIPLMALAAITGGLAIAKIASTPIGDTGGGTPPSITTPSTQSEGTAPNTSFSFGNVQKTTDIPPTKTYVISKDVENQQQLDRQIITNGTY